MKSFDAAKAKDGEPKPKLKINKLRKVVKAEPKADIDTGANETKPEKKKAGGSFAAKMLAKSKETKDGDSSAATAAPSPQVALKKAPPAPAVAPVAAVPAAAPDATPAAAPDATPAAAPDATPAAAPDAVSAAAPDATPAAAPDATPVAAAASPSGPNAAMTAIEEARLAMTAQGHTGGSDTVATPVRASLRQPSAASSPTEADVAVALKADMDRSLMLARRRATNESAQMERVQAARNAAISESVGMSCALDKLNKVLAPQAQRSPAEILMSRQESEALLSRIKDQLSEAAMGTFDKETSGGEAAAALGEDTHQAVASRGKDLILRLSAASNDAWVAANAASAADGASGGEAAASGEAEASGVGASGLELPNSPSSAPKRAAAAAAAAAPSVKIEWQGSMTVHRLTDDAEELANQRSMSGQPASLASLCTVLVLDAEGNVAGGTGWEEHFISLNDAKLWAATYSAAGSGSIRTAGTTGRFRCIVDLRAEGLSVDFEECGHTSTGFAIALRCPSFTLKLAPKRHKVLLEWGAVLSQAMTEPAPPLTSRVSESAYVCGPMLPPKRFEFGPNSSLGIPGPSVPLSVVMGLRGFSATDASSSATPSVSKASVHAPAAAAAVPKPKPRPDAAAWAANYRKNRRRGGKPVLA